MKKTTAIDTAFQKWYSSLKRNRQGFPPKGTLAGALVVLERLKENCNLDIDSHTAAGGSQIKGASQSATRKILSRFGESRPLVAEGGRTNRGLRGAISSMLLALKDVGLCDLAKEQRQTVIEGLQRILVGKIQALHSLARLKVPFDPSKSTLQYIRALLQAAQEKDQHGAVAEYLVGAKLQLRFPDIQVENKRSSTADQPRGKYGDFHIGDTVFHVTYSPNAALLEKCKEAVGAGYRCYLLIPQDFSGNQRFAEMLVGQAVVMLSIETFIAQNVDELAQFSIRAQFAELKKLLHIYNERVDAVEMEKSMLIQIPENM